MVVGSSIGGTGPNGGGDPFHGYIACARVQSGVLTAGDIATNYALGPLVSPVAAVPPALAATPGDGQVVLSWSTAANATGYNIKTASAAAGPYTIIAPNIASLGFTNTGLTDGTIYYYVVSAVNQAGESVNSSPVSAQPVSLARPQFSFASSGGQLQLGWPADHLGLGLGGTDERAGNGLGDELGDGDGFDGDQSDDAAAGGVGE